MLRRVPVVVGLALTLLATGAGCSSTPPVTEAGPVVTGAPSDGTRPPATPGTTPPATSRPGSTLPDAGDIDWAPCSPRGYECGTLAVPVDYADPDGARIDLALKRKPATDPGQRIGSVFVNPGGPGASGIDALPDIARDLGPEVGGRFDVVSWDPRGVGKSAALSCDDASYEYYEEDLAVPRPSADAEREAREWAEACASTDGSVLPFLGTMDVARDLDQLRAAVGDEKLTYAGFSYGSLIGLVYGEMFPERVRAMLLDGIVDPTLDTTQNISSQSASVEGALDRFFAWCRDTPSCAIHDDPEGKTRRVVDEARTDPMQAIIGGERRTISPTIVDLAIATATYSDESWPTLALAIDAALARQPAAIAALAGAYLESGSPSANLAVGCLDSPTPTGPAYDEMVDASVRAAPDLGALNANLGRPCQYWPTPPKPLPTQYDGVGAPPVMVWGTTGDNATPYENAVRVAGMLAGARLVTLDADRHTALGENTCVTDLMAAYLVDLTLPPEGTRC